jgi:TetR/AcrR family transcriptional regulator, fatty acid metabolism regulator protein
MIQNILTDRPDRMTMKGKKTATNAASKILGAATRMFGRMGYRGASMEDVAQEAGVSKGLVHYHFHSKERLLIEAQRATFRQLHRRFAERATRGERGLQSAVDALDAMWTSVRELREGAPFVVETLSLSSQESSSLQKQLRSFYQESTGLLSDGIRQVFADELGSLAIPPERMSVVIRVLLEGLLVELAQAKTPADLAEVDQAYTDMRELFMRFVLAAPEVGEAPSEHVPLPW